MALEGVTKSLAGAAAGIAMLALAGCAGGGGQTGGDPGARPLPQGQNCQTVRGELDKMDRKGIPSKLEAANAGKKLSPGDRAEVDRYNGLLSQYLGARCHL